MHNDHNNPNNRNKNGYRSSHHLENPILFDHHIRKELNLDNPSTKQPEEQEPDTRDAWKQFFLFSLALFFTPLLIL
jgi:hypothetical protein